MVTTEYAYLNKPSGFTNCFFRVFDFLLPLGIKVLILPKPNFCDVKKVAFQEDSFFAKGDLKIFENSFWEEFFLTILTNSYFSKIFLAKITQGKTSVLFTLSIPIPIKLNEISIYTVICGTSKKFSKGLYLFLDKKFWKAQAGKG